MKKKSNTQMAGSAEVDEFSRKFDEEFCLMACMASTTGSSIWYIDNGASSHMTRKKRFFKTCRRVEQGSTLSWVMMRGIKHKELAPFHFRGSLANPSFLLMCYMFQN